MPESASALSFFRSFGYSWLTLMSGPASVPFGIAAIFAPEVWQKVLLAGIAALCAVFASYLVWKHERERGDDLAARVAPKLELLFDPNCTSCVWDRPDIPGQRWIRVGVRNIGLTTIGAVTVSVESWAPDGKRALQLPMAMRPKDDRSDDGLPFALHPVGERHAHVDFIAQRWDRGTAIQINFGPRDVPNRLPPARYSGYLVAQGHDVPACRRAFVIEPEPDGPMQGRPVMRLLGPDEPAPGFPEPAPRGFAAAVRDLQARQDLWGRQ